MKLDDQESILKFGKALKTVNLIRMEKREKENEGYLLSLEAELCKDLCELSEQYLYRKKTNANVTDIEKKLLTIDFAMRFISYKLDEIYQTQTDK